MLLQALLLLIPPAKTDATLYKGSCQKNAFPLESCPAGFNLSIPLRSIGSDNAGRSPFNLPNDIRILSKKCWHLELECTDLFVRITVRCYCSNLGSGHLPLRNASDEEWLSPDTVKWKLGHIEATINEMPDNRTLIELWGCYDHGNGTLSVGSLYGEDGFAEVPEQGYPANGVNCNYINEMVFLKQRSQTDIVCIAFFVALMIGLTGAVLWSTLTSTFQPSLVF